MERLQESSDEVELLDFLPHAAPASASDDSAEEGSCRLEALEASLRQQHDTALSLLRGGDYHEACRAFSQLAAFARRSASPVEGQALYQLAESLSGLEAPMCQVDAAYRQALALAHHNNDLYLSFQILSGMGQQALQSDELDLAEHFHLQALMLAKRVLSLSEEASAAGNLGTCLARVEGRYSECFEHLLRAIDIMQRLGDCDPFELAMLHATLASALDSHGRTSDAKREYLRTLELARAANEPRLEADTLAELADLYERSGEGDRAVRCREEGAQLRRQVARGSVVVQICAESGERLEVTLDTSSSVMDLKAEIQRQWGILEPNQLLSLGQQVLFDSQSMSSFVGAEAEAANETVILLRNKDDLPC